MCLEYDCLSMPFQLLSDLHTYPPPKFVPSYSFFLTQWTHWVKLKLLRWAAVSGHPWIMSNLPWVWPQKKSHSSSFNSQQLPIGPQLEAGPPELSLCLCWNIYQLGLVQAPPAAASSWVHWPYHVQKIVFSSHTSKPWTLRASRAPLLWSSSSLVWKEILVI